MNIKALAKDAVRQMLSAEYSTGNDLADARNALQEAEAFLEGVSSGFFETYDKDARRVARECTSILANILERLERA